MKLMKFPLLCLLILLTFSGVTHAQVCGPGYSPIDIVSIASNNFAKPGDTVNIPVGLTNVRSLSAITFLVEYDKTVLTPITYASDTLITNGLQFDTVQTTPVLIVDTIAVADTSFTNFFEIDTTGGRMNFVYQVGNPNVLAYSLIATQELTNLSIDPDVGRILINLLPTDFGGGIATAIDSGAGTAFYIPFEVNFAAPNGAVASFNFYEVPIFDNAFPPNLISCQYSRYSDTTGELGGDIRPTPQASVFTVDVNAVDPPIINSFTASPTNIVAGGSSTLSWDVANADSIVISNGVGTFTTLSSFIAVSPTVNTTYSLTAYNAGSQTTVQSVSITVGTVIGNNIPTIATVVGSPFTVNQGETVSFSVTASDADASDIITLSALSIPANSSFNQVVGSGSVTGNFSFTPDFTQSGTFSAVFTASDNAGGTSASRTVIINVIEIQNDRLFSTSAIGQQPVGGLSGKRNVYFPVNMVTAQTVYGVQFDFRYDPVFFEVDSFVVTGRTANYVVYDNIGQTPGLIKVVTFGLNNEPIVNVVDTTAIMYAVMSIDSNATPGDYPIYFENGWESVNPDPDFPSLELVVDSGVIQVDNPGDVNLDKHIDVADLVNVVASVINTFTLNERQFDVADVITNDTVDVFDLVGIVNLIFGIPLNPNPAPMFEDERATIQLAYSELVPGGSDIIVVNSETPVDLAAVELEISYDPGSVLLGKPVLAADAEGMSLQYNDDMTGTMKVLVHFTNPYGGSRIESGYAEMIEIPLLAKGEILHENHQIKITQANFSTDAAARVEVDGIEGGFLPTSFSLSQNYPNPFNPTTTIDFSIDANKFVNLEIYNILGQHVISLIDGSMPAGAHSIEWDATNQQGGRVASGVYLYRLTVDDNTQSKKMLLLK